MSHHGRSACQKGKRNRRAFAALCLVGSVSGCIRDAPAPTQLIARPADRLAAVIGFPDPDPVMGALSPIAQHIALALRDSSTRVAIARAMKDPGATLLGLNLRACDSDSLVARVFAAGHRRGGDLPDVVCRAVQAHSGMVLFMDRDRLRGWDGSASPIVTAIANPDATLPTSFHGYRTPTRLVDLPRDGSLQGPILVVFPMVHPTHAAIRASGKAGVGTIVVPDPAPGLLVRPALPLRSSPP